jgi:hypothetical protein
MAWNPFNNTHNPTQCTGSAPFHTAIKYPLSPFQLKRSSASICSNFSAESEIRHFPEMLLYACVYMYVLRTAYATFGALFLCIPLSLLPLSRFWRWLAAPLPESLLGHLHGKLTAACISFTVRMLCLCTFSRIEFEQYHEECRLLRCGTVWLY